MNVVPLLGQTTGKYLNLEYKIQYELFFFVFSLLMDLLNFTLISSLFTSNIPSIVSSNSPGSSTFSNSLQMTVETVTSCDGGWSHDGQHKGFLEVPQTHYHGNSKTVVSTVAYASNMNLIGFTSILTVSMGIYSTVTVAIGGFSHIHFHVLNFVMQELLGIFLSHLDVVVLRFISELF